MKNIKSNMAAFCNCCMVKENNLFAVTLILNFIFMFMNNQKIK